jgi:DNA-binding transcriptional MerR regulator
MIINSIRYNPYLYQPNSLTISQVAMQFNVGVELIHKWTESGLIPHITLTNGEYRYKIKEVRDAFLKNDLKDGQ